MARSHALDDRKRSIEIMRKLSPGDIVNWITTQDRIMRQLGDSFSGNYPS